MDLKNKTVILGITGSIAAYKMANVASTLAKAQCDVHTIMTQNATEIIAPLTFSTLTGHKTVVDTFDKTINYNVAHVSLAKRPTPCSSRPPRPTSSPNLPGASPTTCLPQRPWPAPAPRFYPRP